MTACSRFFGTMLDALPASTEILLNCRESPILVTPLVMFQLEMQQYCCQLGFYP